MKENYFVHGHGIYFSMRIQLIFAKFTQVHQGTVYGTKVGGDELLLSTYMKRDGKKWLCMVPECTYKSDTYKIKRHIYGHFKIKPFKCLYCTSSTNSRENLLSHFMHKHAAHNVTMWQGFNLPGTNM